MSSTKISHLFWDSCCFIAFLNDEKDAYDVSSIEQYLDDAREGKARIYTSTVALAEVRPSFLRKKSIGSFSEFVDDLSGAVIMIDASPNVMTIAGRLRDIPYRKANSDKRQLATPDAIMLASCLYLADTMGVSVDHFHTFDKGKRRGPDGKGVPLLGYDEWCEGIEDDLAGRVIGVSRKEPIHPEPRFVK